MIEQDLTDEEAQHMSEAIREHLERKFGPAKEPDQVVALRQVIEWQESEIQRLKKENQGLRELLGPPPPDKDDQSGWHFDRFVAGDR